MTQETQQLEVLNPNLHAYEIYFTDVGQFA
jgi:hypothetical protein